ncbi:hypothetical protein [Actinopolymorpha sp. B9G3]|uniref:hypothetical protein n=1 Tax=Actinopolymorpha sp. B9G3 TaxID=3158970 RepID=UPI0032D8D0DC
MKKRSGLDVDLDHVPGQLPTPDRVRLDLALVVQLPQGGDRSVRVGLHPWRGPLERIDVLLGLLLRRAAHL